MRNLKKAIDLIKEFEGLYLKAYADPRPKNPIWTIGYGTIQYPDGRPVKKGDVITKTQAEELLSFEVEAKTSGVEKCLKKPATDNQFCAMLSLAYNIGSGAFARSSGVRHFNLGDIQKAAQSFLLFNKAVGVVLKGLVRRREKEKQLFLSDQTEESIMSIKPKSKPALNADEVLKIVKANKVTDKVCLVAVRGYYLDSMGVKGQNDRGIYDDAMFWVSPDGVISFNGNCDASKYRKGKGSGAEKGMASLNPGVWRYKPGTHYGSVPHPAFRQAAPVKITRDGTNGNYQDTLNSSINIHRGGANGTSSLGCQTIPREQWDAFKALGDMLLKKHGQKEFAYVLIEETSRRSGKLIV